ncbi:phosphoribosyltransferase [Priestia megaterium]|uniref:phosphoribosyltransferase n=1 Tax=Priestia megaterium TaxID=1404 RepID=UPI002E222703|nr:phosphoribosyltransferase [Priestia megaterium]
MRKRTKHKEISTSTFNKLGILFEEKGWEVDEKQNDSSLFNRFCELLNCLNVEQQEFIIDLTHNYQRFNFNDYNKLISKILNTMAEKLEGFNELNTFFVMPLVSEEDKNKIKSSTLVAYLFQSPQIKYNNKMSNKNFKVRHELTPKELNKINESPKQKLLLVDDFIGTGETAMAAYDYYVSLGIKKEKIIILSLVSLLSGYQLIQAQNIDVFSGEIFKRALSDYFSDSELTTKVNMMKSIEEIVAPHDDYKFGYKGSEALITLVRTPNNTFPVYWLDKGKKVKRAPFPRGGN